MKGYAQPITDEGWLDRDTPIIGVVVAPSFPDKQAIVDTLKQGDNFYRAKGIDPFWVVRERDELGRECMALAGLEPVRAPAVPRKVFPQGGAWRDLEILSLCSKVIIFHTPGASTTEAFLKRRFVSDGMPRFQHEGKDKISLVERGQRKARARKGRKPRGA